MKTTRNLDKVGYYGIASFMFFIGLITLYPILYVISMSLSDPISVLRQEVFLWPKGLSLKAYELVLKNEQVWVSYSNTILYTLSGTLLNLVMTVIAAYPLSRRNFCIRNPLMVFISVTMFFSGGMIPMFMLINNLGLYDTRWAMILPGAVGTWYIIIARTFFQSLPEALVEAAKIEGANDLKILHKIILPLSKSIIAVLALYYAVGHWNSFMNAILYLKSKSLQPLQVYLRSVLVENSITGADVPMGAEKDAYTQQIKYSVIVISILPIMCVYPFLQKHFAKGVMIGSIKG